MPFTDYFNPLESQHQPNAEIEVRHGMPGLKANGLPPSVLAILELDQVDVAMLEPQQRAGFVADQEAAAAVNEAKAQLAMHLQDAERASRAPDPKEVAKLEAAIAKTKRMREQHHTPALLEISRRLTNARERQRRNLNYVNQAAAAGDLLELAPVVKLPKGADPIVVAEETPQAIAKLLDEVKVVSKAAPDVATTKATLRGQVEKLAAAGTPQVTFAGRMGPRVRFPQIAVRAEATNTGEIPTAPDAGSLIAWALKDQLLAEVDRQVDQHYESVELALSDDQKRQRLAQLDEEILALERIEAEAVRQARAAGYEIAQRSELDPRACLGLDGPAPSRRR